MRKFFSAFLLLPLAVACQSIKSEAASAAEEYYLKYADRKDLTVALVSGYEKEGTTLNVVKLQAHDDATFRLLLDEFGVRSMPSADSQTPVANSETDRLSDSKNANELKVIVDGDTLGGKPTFSSLHELGSFLDTLLRVVASHDTGQDNPEKESGLCQQDPVASLMKTANVYGNSG